MPRSLGCCGESGSLSQCIRYNADVLRGVHDWSSCPAECRSCVCACTTVCLWRDKSVHMVCVLWTRNHKKDLRAPCWCQIPWPSGHMANTQPKCGVCLWTNRMTVTVCLGCNMLNVTVLCKHIDCHRYQVPSALCGSITQRTCLLCFMCARSLAHVHNGIAASITEIDEAPCPRDCQGHPPVSDGCSPESETDRLSSNKFMEEIQVLKIHRFLTGMEK